MAIHYGFCQIQFQPFVTSQWEHMLEQLFYLLTNPGDGGTKHQL